MGGALKKSAPSGGRREHFWGVSCEKSIDRQITSLESVFKIGSNSEILCVCLSKCVGLSIILTRPFTTTISFTVVGRFIMDYKGGDYTLMRQKIIDTNWETLINDYRYTLGNFDK
jgi:hypothetical protein